MILSFTINSLVTHVTSRMKFIELFEKVIHDDRSYERRGRLGHNLLRTNIWLIDQNYSVLHDDETLKNIVYAQWEVVTVKTETSDPTSCV